ncbi:MAG: OsmC family protein [candidate division WOR-3 bacterium]|nr:OsmC family protein [candidate division WOR-3 bacterium]MCX7947696.1 OsmC family protein [candidate division WOR-3 bacterium]MDW8150573.1 OsmC family protein [candidate division WOR-3 bacterium]
MNNVNVKQLFETREKIIKNQFPSEREFIVEGEWVFDKHIQFTGRIEYTNGIVELSTDQPPQSGGYGNAPNPVQICVFGVISCYSTTFMTIASLRGIEIKKLKAKGSILLDMRSVFEIEDLPVVKKVSVELDIESDVDRSVLEEIRLLANKKCPAAYVIQNPIELETKIK